jgi:ribonuclease VapC
LLRQIRARVVPFDDDHAWAATGAFLRFGRGRHPAGLNFGDCMSYALASNSGERLLFTGDDFGLTDIA